MKHLCTENSPLKYDIKIMVLFSFSLGLYLTTIILLERIQHVFSCSFCLDFLAILLLFKSQQGQKTNDTLPHIPKTNKNLQIFINSKSSKFKSDTFILGYTSILRSLIDYTLPDNRPQIFFILLNLLEACFESLNMLNLRACSMCT